MTVQSDGGGSRVGRMAAAPSITDPAIRAILGFPSLPSNNTNDGGNEVTETNHNEAGPPSDPSYGSSVSSLTFPTLAFSAKASTFRAARELTDYHSDPQLIAQSLGKEGPAIVRRIQIDASVQTGGQLKSTGAAQTLRNEPCNVSVSTAEVIAQAEADLRALNDISQSNSPSASAALAINEGVVAQFERAIQQNMLNDIFGDEYSALWDEELILDSNSANDLQEYQSFTEIKLAKDKPVSSIETHPDLKSIIAVTCVTPSTVSESIEAALSSKAKKAPIFLWSVHDTINPVLILEAPEDVLSFKFMPRDPLIVVAGCSNGQLVVWDLAEHRDLLFATKKPKTSDLNEMNFGAATNNANNLLFKATPNNNNAALQSNEGNMGGANVPVVRHTIASSIETAHRGPVTEISLVPSQFTISYSGEVTRATSATSQESPEQILTTSLDGFLYMWELPSREILSSLDLAWKPLFKAPICCAQNTKETGITRALPRISRTFESSTITKLSRIICGTEEGVIVFADWMNLKDQPMTEKGNGSHFTAVADMERSPFVPDLFLSIGGELSAIWKEEAERPYIFLPVSETYATCGRFSQTRASVLFLGRADGNVEIWDLTERSDAPVFTKNVTSHGVISMRLVQVPNKREQVSTYLAVGDGSGTLILLTISRKYLKPIKNELEHFNALLDRQAKKQLPVVASAVPATKPSATTTKSETETSTNIQAQETLENMFKELEGSLLQAG